MSPPAPHPDHAEIVEQLTNNLLISANLGQHVIMTTEDKIRLAISDHLKHMEERKSWLPPLSLFVPIIAAFVTADFKEAVLTAAQWHAIFVVFGLASFVWLIYSIYRAVTAPTVEDFINALKVPK